MKLIRFAPGGEVRKLHDESDVALYGEASRRRASHVEPATWLLRVLFRFIRNRVSDESQLAQFTRWWPCRWQAQIIDGPLLGPFHRRSDAITAEQDWLTKNWVLAELTLVAAPEPEDQL